MDVGEGLGVCEGEVPYSGVLEGEAVYAGYMLRQGEGLQAVGAFEGSLADCGEGGGEREVRELGLAGEGGRGEGGNWSAVYSCWNCCIAVKRTSTSDCIACRILSNSKPSAYIYCKALEYADCSVYGIG